MPDMVIIDTANTTLMDAIADMSITTYVFEGNTYVHINEINKVVAHLCAPVWPPK